MNLREFKKPVPERIILHTHPGCNVFYFKLKVLLCYFHNSWWLLFKQ